MIAAELPPGRRLIVWLTIAIGPIACWPSGRRAAAAEPPAEAAADAWPVARGCIEGTGRSAAVLSFPLREAWHRRFEETAFEATPIIAAGTIYIGDLDGTFHAIALDDGRTRWSFKGEAGFSAAAAFVPLGAGKAGDAEAVVIAGDSLGVVRAFEATSGRVVWSCERSGEISGGPSVLPGAGGRVPPRVLVGSQDASLSSLDAATGEELWRHSIADQIRCMPTVVAGRVLIAGCDGRLHAIDAATGQPSGEVAIDGPTGTTPAALEAAVFFGSEGGSFYGIDLGPHGEGPPTIRWRKKPTGGGQAYRSSAAITDSPAGPIAIVGTRRRAVEAFATADGGQIWRAAMRGHVDASPAIVGVGGSGGQAAIVADAAGRIAAIQTSDGSVLWEFDAGRGFTASPAVAAERVVLAGEDGTVWCFGPTE